MGITYQLHAPHLSASGRWPRGGGHEATLLRAFHGLFFGAHFRRESRHLARRIVRLRATEGRSQENAAEQIGFHHVRRLIEAESIRG